MRGTATQVEIIRTVYYPDGAATIDVQLLGADGAILDGAVLDVAKAVTDKWAIDGDEAFYAESITKNSVAPMSVSASQ